MLTGRHRSSCALTSVVALAFFPFSATGSVRYDEPSRTWHLISGPVEYRLGEKESSVFLKYFGPTGQPDWSLHIGRTGLPQQDGERHDIDGLAEGESLKPEDLELVSHEEIHPKPDVDELRVVFQHRHIPLGVSSWPIGSQSGRR